MTECKFMEIDSMVEGKKAFLDRSDHSIVFQKDCGGCVRHARCDVKDAVIPDIEPFEIVLPGGHVTPEVALEMSKKILGGLKAPAPVKMTVGDLSVVKAQKNRPERVRQRLRNMKDPKLSIGDLSVATDQKESIEAKVDADLSRRDGSLSVGDLFRGMRPNDLAPSTSESQEVLMEMQRKQREKREEILHIQNLMAGGKDQRLEEYIDKYLKNKA